MTLGEKIQTLRKSKGLSQEQLAEELNVSRQAVSKWEAEQSIPEIDKIIALSDFFTVSTDYLLKDEPQIADSSEPANAEAPTPDFEKDENNERNRKISTALFAVAIMLYISCAVPLLVLQNEIGLVILLIIVAIATGLMIFRASFNSRNDIQEEKAEDKTDPNLKTIKSTINIIFVAVYFMVSFFSGAWHITWIIFLISAVIKEIACAIYEYCECEKK